MLSWRQPERLSSTVSISSCQKPDSVDEPLLIRYQGLLFGAKAEDLVVLLSVLGSSPNNLGSGSYFSSLMLAESVLRRELPPAVCWKGQSGATAASPVPAADAAHTAGAAEACRHSSTARARWLGHGLSFCPSFHTAGLPLCPLFCST